MCFFDELLEEQCDDNVGFSLLYPRKISFIVSYSTYVVC